MNDNVIGTRAWANVKQTIADLEVYEESELIAERIANAMPPARDEESLGPDLEFSPEGEVEAWRELVGSFAHAVPTEYPVEWLNWVELGETIPPKSRSLFREALNAREAYEAASYGWLAEMEANRALRASIRHPWRKRITLWWRETRCRLFAHDFEDVGNEHFGIQRQRCRRCLKVHVERRRSMFNG